MQEELEEIHTFMEAVRAFRHGRMGRWTVSRAYYRTDVFVGLGYYSGSIDVMFMREEAGPDGWSRWIKPANNYKASCCDCGLVHTMEFAIDAKDNVIFRVKRANRSSGQLRRHSKYKFVKK